MFRLRRPCKQGAGRLQPWPLLCGEPRNEHIFPAGGAFSWFYLYLRAFATSIKRWKGINDCFPNVKKSHQEGKLQMVIETNSTEGTQVLLLCVSNDYCCHVKFKHSLLKCSNPSLSGWGPGGHPQRDLTALSSDHSALRINAGAFAPCWWECKMRQPLWKTALQFPTIVFLKKENKTKTEYLTQKSHSCVFLQVN